MSLDLERKIEIQQKLIEELTAENDQLTNDIRYERGKAEIKEKKYEKLMGELLSSKSEYERLINEFAEIKEQYHGCYDICKELIRK